MRVGRVVVPIALLLSLVCASTAHAQSPSERLEVAADLSLLNVSNLGSTNAGIGGRVTFDLTNHIAVEGAVEYFPNDRITSPESRITGPGFQLYDDRSRTTGLFGVKVGSYTPRFGWFAKARPGFTHLKLTGGGCLGTECGRILAFTDFIVPEYRTEFAFDVGGGVEVYPSARTVARVEMGDTIIRHRSVAMPCYGQPCTSHNVSSRFGLGWRF